VGYGIQFLAHGPRACFTRPEMKAERVSYDVMTPSAARGMLENVYWKPAIKWKVDSITVLNQVRFETFRRNEVGNKLSYANARSAYNNNADIWLDATSVRQQRATTYLVDVSYLVTAHFDLTEKAGPEDTCEKHYNIALRRLRKGQCFNQPYFGCREFPASVEIVEEGTQIPTSYYAGTGEIDLGYMLYDIDFDHEMEPMFFRAKMVDGLIDTSRQEVKR
jgi:CRISPR-associated protein Cas5d